MNHRSSLSLAVLLVVAAALRLYSISTDSFWLDEYTSFEIASKSLNDILTGKGFDNHTPPLYYILLHFWLYLFPATEFGLRSLSVVFDLLSITLAYTIFSRQFSRRIGILTSLMLTISPYAVYYAQEARMYSLAMCLSLMLYGLGLRLITAPTVSTVLLTIVTAIAALYTHYYCALFLALYSLALLLYVAPDFMRFRAWFIAMFISLLGFIPWIATVLTLVKGGGQGFREFTLQVIPYTVIRFVLGYGVMPLNYGSRENAAASAMAHMEELLSLAGPLLLAAIFGLFVLIRSKRRESLLPLLPLFGVPLLALLLSLKAPMYSERYLVVVFPFYTLLLAFALEAFRLRLLSILIVCLALVPLFNHYANPDFGKEQWRDVAEYISTRENTSFTISLEPHYTAGVLLHYLPSGFVIVPTSELPREQRVWLIERGKRTDASMQIVETRPLLDSKIFPFENGITVSLLDPGWQGESPDY